MRERDRGLNELTLLVLASLLRRRAAHTADGIARPAVAQPWRSELAASPEGNGSARSLWGVLLAGLYLVIGCRWQFAWQFGLIASGVVTCHKQFIIKYCLSATLGHYHVCYKMCYSALWSVNSSTVLTLAFCLLKSAGGSQLAARHGYLWPAEDILCFLCSGAKNKGWLTLGAGGVTKHGFKGAGTPQKGLMVRQFDFKSFSQNERHNLQPLKLRSWSNVGFMESAVLIFSTWVSKTAWLGIYL